MFNSRFAPLTICMIVWLSSPALADDDKNPFADNLLGDMEGKRAQLLKEGVDVVVEYKGDVWRDVSGGTKRGDSYLDNLDVKFSLDGEKLFGIENNKSLIYFLTNEGGKPNARQVGSLQGIDNIEVAKNAPRLYEAWTEQGVLGKKLTLLVGLHDLNTEFLAPDISANFLKPAMQIGQAFAQTGRNGPSIFPNAGLAARLKYLPTSSTYLMAAAFDGVPGNPAHPYATRVDLGQRDGALLVAEAGWAPIPEGEEVPAHKIAVGGWSYTHDASDLLDVDSAGNPVKRASRGAYMLSHCKFYNDKDSGHALSAFLRTEIANGDSNRTSWSYETGLVGSGWVARRPDSEIGIGMAQAHNSSKYVTVAAPADKNEYSMELYYRDTVYRGIRLQPDVQYIVNPNTDTVTKNATVIGLRTDINFLMQESEKNNYYY